MRNVAMLLMVANELLTLQAFVVVACYGLRHRLTHASPWCYVTASENIRVLFSSLPSRASNCSELAILGAIKVRNCWSKFRRLARRSRALRLWLSGTDPVRPTSHRLTALQISIADGPSILCFACGLAANATLEAPA